MKKKIKKTFNVSGRIRFKAYNAKMTGKKIKAIRTTLGLTRREVADRVKWTPQRWADLENGRHGDVMVSTLYAVANALQCEAADLLDSNRNLKSSIAI